MSVTDELLARVRARREAGQTYKAIGKALGRSRQWVAMVCAEHGIPKRIVRRRDRGVEKLASLPPADPIRAAMITESKKQFWRTA